MRLLIDECLSIDLIPVAIAAGHEAQHVAWIGKAGWSCTQALSSSCRTLVAMQTELFRTALEAVTMPDDLINRVLEISLAGEEITLDLYDLPQDPPA